MLAKSTCVTGQVIVGKIVSAVNAINEHSELFPNSSVAVITIGTLTEWPVTIVPGIGD